MTRAEILSQRAQYEAAKQEALNRANLYQGAVEALDWVLARLSDGEGVPAAPSPAEGPGK